MANGDRQEESGRFPIGEPQRQSTVPDQRIKRHRRVVSKEAYVQMVGKKFGLFSLCGFMLTVGLLFSVFALICLALGLLIPIFFWGAIAGGAFWYSRRNFVRAKAIEPVRPLTNSTSHLLTAEESLVRASAAPSTQQKAELLRAAQSQRETPAEELLRATNARPKE